MTYVANLLTLTNTPCFNYLFIVLTETWLSINFYSFELNLINYNTFRCERSPLKRFGFKRVGGVLIFVLKVITSFLFIIPNNSIKHLFVRLFLNSFNFILCNVYLLNLSSIDLCTVRLNTGFFIVQNYSNHIFSFIWDNNLLFIIKSNYAHCITSHLN